MQAVQRDRVWTKDGMDWIEVEGLEDLDNNSVVSWGKRRFKIIKTGTVPYAQETKK